MRGPRRPTFLRASRLMLVAALLVGCSAESPATSPDDAAADEGQPFADAPSDEMPTSETASLIEAALTAGEVTAEEALLFRAYSVFGDERLPQRFASPGETQDHLVMRDIAGAWPELPDETRAALAPFFFPPVYENSWASGGEPSAQNAQFASAVRPADRRTQALAGETALDCATERFREGFYVNIPTDNGKVRVWWRNGVPTSAALGTAASAIADEIDSTIWPKLTQLMGHEPMGDGGVGCFNGEDDRFDIYLLDVPISGGAKALTIAYPGACTDTPAFMVISPAGLRRWTVAHELFHAIQFAYSYSGACSDYTAMDEATATWAADYVYPADQDEHKFWWFNRFPESNLFNRAYETWTFFYSLVQHHGEDQIPAIYAATEQFDNEVDAIDATIPGGIKEFWPDFVRDVWNQDPVDSFAVWDGFTRGPLQNGSGQTFEWSLGDETLKEHDNVLGVSGFGKNAVLDWSFAGDVRSIELTAINAGGGHDGLSVQALIQHSDGTWREEDWSDREEVTYCRDKPDEDVSRIVLLYANSEPPVDSSTWSAPLIKGKAPHLELRSTCEAGYRVEATRTETWEALADTLITASGTATEGDPESGYVEGEGTYSESRYAGDFCPGEGDDPEAVREFSGVALFTVIVTPDGLIALVTTPEGLSLIGIDEVAYVPMEGGTVTSTQEVPRGQSLHCGGAGTIETSITITPIGDEP